MKNRFLPFLIVFLALTAFFAGYILIRSSEKLGSQTGTLLEKFDDKELPKEDNTEDNQPFILSARRVISPINSPNSGSVVYYEKNTGKVFEINISDRTEKVVSDKILPNFISGIWSPDRRSVINSFVSEEGTIFKYLNTITDKTSSLDKNILSVAFSTDGNLIASYYLDTTASPISAILGEEDLSADGMPANKTGKVLISQPDGSYPKKILDTRLKDVEIGWPIPDKISLKTRALDMFLLTEDGKLEKLFETKPSLELKWSPSGKKIIYSFLETIDNVTESKLWLKDVESKTETPLELAGSASTCTWSIDDINAYCAIPDSPSVDNIYAIDTVKISSKPVVEPLTSIREMFFSNLEDYIIFISASDEKLYGIKIP